MWANGWPGSNVGILSCDSLYGMRPNCNLQNYIQMHKKEQRSPKIILALLKDKTEANHYKS